MPVYVWERGGQPLLYEGWETCRLRNLTRTAVCQKREKKLKEEEEEGGEK